MLALVFACASVAGAVSTVAWMMRCARSTGGIAGHEPTPQEVRSHVLWGSFYANPADPRGWIPKPRGIGVTPNFRTRRNALVFAALILLTALGAVGLVVVVLPGGQPPSGTSTPGSGPPTTDHAAPS
jgi:uncharacterized membrane protein